MKWTFHSGRTSPDCMPPVDAFETSHIQRAAAIHEHYRGLVQRLMVGRVRIIDLKAKTPTSDEILYVHDLHQHLHALTILLRPKYFKRNVDLTEAWLLTDRRLNLIVCLRSL